MPQASLLVSVPKSYRLSTIVFSHGWYDLPPVRWDEANATVSWVGRSSGEPEAFAVSQSKAGELSASIHSPSRVSDSKKRDAVAHIRTVLGCDFDASSFYRSAGKEYAWAKKLGAGPLMRGASVFEDAVKMLATTNCSWALTKQMVGRLIDNLGESSPTGEKAFPTSSAMAEQSTSFYRDVVRAGYRADYFRDFARRVADGAVDPESWGHFEGSTDDLLKSITAHRGFGRYAAENLCRLLGRFDGLALDSWCFKKIPQARPELKGDPEKAMRAYYSKFGAWQGLALWLDLTRDWHEEKLRKARLKGFSKQ